MSKKSIITVIGTRPNLIKISQFERVFANYQDVFSHQFIYTNQHYDANLSSVFMEEFSIKHLSILGNISNTNPADQIGHIIIELQKKFIELSPDLVIVVGDVNSTLAAAIAASKLNIRVAHLESGLRSFDREMPEEINRLITDQLADIHFVTEQSGLDNLDNENLRNEHTYFVGNTMIDTLVALTPKIEASTILEKIGMQPEQFILLTMHRPRNVDSKEKLEKLVELIKKISEARPIVFPLHPRTKASLDQHNLFYQLEKIENLKITEPLGYLDFQKLIQEAKLVLTDSGGIQEETTFRQVPCITIRENTERPSTTTIGSNQLLSFEVGEIMRAINNQSVKKNQIPPFWDGKTTERIGKILENLMT